MYTSRVAALRAERQWLSRLLQAQDDADAAAGAAGVDDLQGVPQAELLQAIESNMSAERVSGRMPGLGWERGRGGGLRAPFPVAPHPLPPPLRLKRAALDPARPSPGGHHADLPDDADNHQPPPVRAGEPPGGARQKGPARRGMGRRGGLARPPPALRALARLRRTPRRRAPPWLTPVRLARVRRAPGQIWIYAWPYPVHQTATNELLRALLRANDPSVNAEWLD
jgi:hypothetical protein